MKKDECEKCLNSRPIISENGWHSICTLSPKKAIACHSGFKDSFVSKPKSNKE